MHSCIELVSICLQELGEAMAAAAVSLGQGAPGVHALDTADGLGFTLLHRYAQPQQSTMRSIKTALQRKHAIPTWQGGLGNLRPALTPC